MKQVKPVLYLSLILAIITACQDSQKSNLALLSGKIPTDSALIFAPDIISTDAFEFAITFTPDMDEVFWTRRLPDANNEVFTLKLVEGEWTAPEPAFFKAQTGWDFEPHINPQGTLLYFGSTRPLPDSAKSNGLHQWYSTRTQNGWSEPVPLANPFMDKSVIMYLTSSAKGNLFFTTGEKGDKPEDWVIYQSINQEGSYESLDRMGEAINFGGKYIAHSYIAPDESYIIYDAEHDDGHGDNDLYISFNKNGQWTRALNMGPKVNTGLTEMCPSVSPNGKYLFFHRGNENQGDIYWVDFHPIKAQLELHSQHESQ